MIVGLAAAYLVVLPSFADAIPRLVLADIDDVTIS
jgi:hypothetical protein